MPVLVYDPAIERQIRRERDKRPEANQYDEVWEGVLVVAPLPNNEHQRIVSRLTAVFHSLIDWDRGDQVLPGINLSDRNVGWLTNYREPDVAVYLNTNPAKDCDTHWVGGPDLAVEVVSPGERPWDKLPFYAQVNTREVLIVNRDPWELELYQLKEGKMVLAGKSKPSSRTTVLASAVLPIAFHLKAGKPRPAIIITHTENKQLWSA